MAKSKKKQSEEIDVISDDDILDFEDEEENVIDDDYIKDEEDDDDDNPDKKLTTEYIDDEDEVLSDNDDYNDFEITEQEMKTQTFVTVPPEKRITKPFLNKYERARILSTRTKQLSLGAKPLVKIETDKPLAPYDIALLELKEKMIPIIIKRMLPSGKIELWKIEELVDTST
jgi:DNA-directed RNA polymerase I, II, and III subunit RPABC2